MTTSDRSRSLTRPALAPGRVRRGWTALVLAGVSPLLGCYTNVPVASPPAPGTTLVLDLNDRGRVALGDSIGPSASRIEGVVQTRRDSSYVLRVSSVQYLNGQSNRWSGEPLTIRTDLVRDARERRYSRGRTWGLALGVAAAVVAVVLATDLVGLGSEPDPPGNPPVDPIDQ